MKNLLVLFLTLLISNNLTAQDCDIQLPQDSFICDFRYAVKPLPIGGFWTYDCEGSFGSLMIEAVNDSIYLFTFADCGEYTLEYNFDDGDCQSTGSMTLFVDDPSASSSYLGNDNDLGYGSLACVGSGASGCGNTISLSGQEPPDPVWNICSDFLCQSSLFFPIATPYPFDTCMAMDIDITSIFASADSSSCWDGDQDAFLVVDYETGEVLSNDFFTFLDSLNQELLLDFDGSCPIASDGCFSMDASCLDSITYDTTELLFPVHLGGQWALLHDGDTLLLQDTTFIFLGSSPYLFIIEPSHDYYGPGNIEVSLWELINGDTIPPTSSITLSMQWIENWTYDTLEWVDAIYHYSDELGCQSCGGHINASSFNIPEIPTYDCGPVNLFFEGPCACVVNTGNFNTWPVTCAEPCVDIEFIGFSSEGAYETYWHINGGIVPGNFVTVCEGGSYMVEMISLPSYCSDFFWVTIPEYLDPPIIQMAEVPIINCIDPCVTLMPIISSSEPYAVLWVGPEGFSSSVEFPIVCIPGIYTITVINTFSGCISSLDVEVLETEEVIEVNLAQNICDGEVFSHAGNDFSVSGLYDFTVLYDDACDTLFHLDLIVETPVIISISESICEGDVYSYAGVDYSEEGDYDFTLASNTACDTSVSISISIDEPVLLSLTEVVCDGEALTVGNMTFTDPGNYSFSLPSETACDTQVDLQLGVVIDDIVLSGSLEINCTQPVSELTAYSSNQDIRWEWQDESGEIISYEEIAEIEKAGEYEVVMFSNLSNDCIYAERFEILGDFELPDLSFESFQQINCTDEMQLLVAIDDPSSYSFEWTGPFIMTNQENNLGPMINGPGTYQLVATSEAGCISEISIEVEQIEPLELQYDVMPSCTFENNGQLRINSTAGGIGPILYSIDNGEWTDEDIFENLSPGTTFINTQQSDGCEKLFEIDIPQIQELTQVPDGDFELCGLSFLEFNLQQSDQAGDVSYVWSDGSNEANRILNRAGYYSVEISNSCETIHQEFNLTDSRLGQNVPLYIPNAFSPNGDGINDELLCYGDLELSNFQFNVYDRWGNLIFESDATTKGWDGQFNGKLVPTNSYVWVLEAEFLDCDETVKRITRHGSVAIII